MKITKNVAIMLSIMFLIMIVMDFFNGLEKSKYYSKEEQISVVYQGNTTKDNKINHVYSYPIRVISVYDGDTINADIDMGLGIKMINQKIRLLGCDAYELSDKVEDRGFRAKSVTEKFLEKGTIKIMTFGKKDSFGRILADIVDNGGNNLKDVLSSASLITGRFSDTDQPYQTMLKQHKALINEPLIIGTM